VIREATRLDCINLTALSLEVWLQTYCIDGITSENSKYALSMFTEEYFESLFKNPKYRLIVYVEDSYLRGYALVNLDSKYKARDVGFEIEKLYVHSTFQGKNIGKKLLNEIKIRFGHKFWLYTWVRNKSIGFYQHLGFTDIGQYNFKLGDEVIENRVLAYGETASTEQRN
jgi:ribosomal protein S18 acetylase RimI-like enzyme